MDIQDKIVIVTGASMGIGEATALAFSAAVAKVVLAARSADKLHAVAQRLSGESLIVPTDMIDKDQVYKLIEQARAKFGRIDMLINNAGQAAAGPVATVDPEHYRAIIELNLFGPLYAMQAVVPVMKAQPEGGVIINISSNVSKMAIPGIGAYASTKYALNGLSYTARAELAPDNIRVIVFCPGLTATDFGKNALRRESVTGPQRTGMVPDSVDAVAQRILEAARTEPAELGMPMQGSPPVTPSTQ